MKKIILITILLFIGVLNTRSQLTLTSSINPTAGDIEVQVRADTTGIYQGNSGANQFWNFPSLSHVDSTNNGWILPSNTPYGSQFPTSNICALDTCYNYFNETAALCELVGYFSHGTAIHYSNPETIITFPFTYNSTGSDNFAALILNNGDTLYHSGTTTFLGDAWGTINLPFGTFLNSLRIKTIISMNDSSAMYQQNVHTVYTIYDWYVPGKKFFVLKIMYSTITIPNFGTYSSKNVFYDPSNVPIGVIRISNNVPDKYSLNQNYPNPFNPSTNIRYQIATNSNVKLTVFDILGRDVATLVNEKQEAGTYEIKFDASKLSSGVYFYKLEAPGYTITKKMNLIK